MRRWMGRHARAAVSGASMMLMAAGCCLCHHDTAPPMGVIAGPPPPALPSPWKAGAAVVEIAVPSGAPLAGYGGPPRRELTLVTLPLNAAALAGKCFDPTPADPAVLFKPSTGKKDAVNARALVLANDSRKIAIVKLDTIGMSRRLRDDLSAAASGLGIAAPDLVVLATHTHSGPGGVSKQILWEVAATDCYADPVYKAVLQAATSALTQANTALQPAKLGIGSSTVLNASENRDGRAPVIDRTLGVIKITTTTGTPLAALFNFAIHGTGYAASNMQLSADCMGVMEHVVETGIAGVVAIFTNGAEGDIAPASNQTVDQVGQQVGNGVVALWPTISTVSSGALSTAFKDVAMPSPSLNPAGCMPLPGTSTSMCSLSGFPATLPIDPDWLSTTLPFQAVSIDSTVLVAIPGEPITEIGADIKQSGTTKGFAHTYVLGLANDHGGYFTTLTQYQAATYEGQSTLYGPTTGAVVVQSASDVINLLP